jgi:hypothetical protein
VWVFITQALKAADQRITDRHYESAQREKKFEWKSYQPIDYYLISFAVADYQNTTFMHSGRDG